MNNLFLADVIVVLHSAYVGFVVIGELAIVVGALRGWLWIRNFWFRALHLLAIAFVAWEAMIGMPCPLTTWEQSLRAQGGQTSAPASFVARLASDVLFCPLPDWVFPMLHIGFAVLVVVTFVLAPPHWRTRDPAPGRQARRDKGAER